MTQSLPEGDLFTDNATHYGAHGIGWLNIQPWVTAGDTVTGYAIPCPASALHSGYSAGASNVAAARSGTGGTAASDMGVFVHRAYYATDARIANTFRFHTQSGAATTDSPRFVGVCGRVSGGSYLETLGFESIKDCTGYFFILASTSALGAKWNLLRVNAGVVTTVASAVTATFPNGFLTDIAAQSLMSMSVADTAGNPVIVCRATIAGVNSVIFNVTDSTGSKITAAGRWGICLGKDRQSTSPTLQTAYLSIQAAILDLGTLTFAVIDEWYRGGSLNVGASVTDGAGVTGRSLQPAWRGDGRSSTTKSNQRDTNRIKTDAAGLPADCISARPSPNIWDHHRSAVFNVTNPSSSGIRWGIKLRGTLNGTGVFCSGWYFEIQHSVAGAGLIDAYLYRVLSTGGLNQLAHAFSVSGITLGSDHTLDFHVYNSGPGGQFAGTPTLVCKIGSTVVSWISDGADCDIDGSNVARFVGSGAALSGESEGMYLTGHPTGPATVRADTWTQLALAEAVVAEDDQASFSILSAAAGATGTLTVPDEWPIEETHSFASIDHEYDSGHVNRVLIQDTDLRSWEIHADAITDVERDTLIDFFDDHAGVEVPFSWVEPRGSTVVVNFTDDELADRLRDVGVHSYSIGLAECPT